MNLPFKVSDRVTNKRLGPMCRGTIFNIVSGEFYAEYLQSVGYTHMLRWDQLYPSWKEGLIAYIRRDYEAVILTREEYDFACKNKQTDDNFLSYEETPSFGLVGLPFDDLELV